MKDKNIFKILIYCFLLIPFFKPDYFNYYGNYGQIYKYAIIFSTLIALFMYLKKKKISKIIILISIFLSIFMISDAINSNDLSNSLDLVIETLGLCVLTDFGIKNDKKNFLKSFEIVLSILVYLNFISLFLYPNGMYVNNNGFSMNWILGYKNRHILYIIPAILLSYLNNNQNKLSLRTILLLIAGFVSTIKVWSGTALIGMALILIFFAFKWLFSIKIFNIKNYVIVYIIVFFWIIVFRIQNLFDWLIVDILSKDLTFTGRIYIWDKATQMINQKPIFGYGNQTLKYSATIYTTHNQILEILFKTGFVGLISYLSIIISSCKNLYKYRKTFESKFISLIILIYFIMMIAEYYNFMLTFFIFVIAYNIKYLIKND